MDTSLSCHFAAGLWNEYLAVPVISWLQLVHVTSEIGVYASAKLAEPALDAGCGKPEPQVVGLSLPDLGGNEALAVVEKHQLKSPNHARGNVNEAVPLLLGERRRVAGAAPPKICDIWSRAEELVQFSNALEDS